MLKTVSIHAKHVLYIRTLLRTLEVGIKNTDLPIKNLSRLLRKYLGCSMRFSTVIASVIQDLCLPNTKLLAVEVCPISYLG